MSYRKFMNLLVNLPPESAFIGFISDKTNYNLASYNPDTLKI